MKAALLLVAGMVTGALGAHLFMSLPYSATESLYEASSSIESAAGTTQGAVAAHSNPANNAGSSAMLDLSALQSAVEGGAVAALLDAAALSERAERRRTVMLIGRLWAGIDPQAALAGASLLPPELRDDYNASVASEWANLDAQAFLGFAEQTASIEALAAGLEVLVATDPGRVYEVSGRLTGVSATSVATHMHDVQRAALLALTDRDPEAAMLLIEPWLSRIDMSPLPQEVVTRFARANPDAALAWLNSLDAATNTHRRVVLEGVAQVDFVRAFEFASARPSLLLDADYALGRAALADRSRVAEIASMLLQRDSSLANRVLDGLVGNWTYREPESAVDWMLANAGTVDPSLAKSIASGYAATDLEAAMSLLERVPPHLGGMWVKEVATQYADMEPAAAFDWIRQYQGQSVYQDLHSIVVMSAVNSDPRLAAAMIDDVSPALQSVAAPSIAQAFADRDPLAAAEWASSLNDTAAASSALSSVIRNWVRRDMRSATDWATGLSRGELRDEAIYDLIAGSYGINLDPGPLLDEIDDDFTRKLAQQSAMGSNVSNRPALARELAEELVSDPDFADYAREVLELTGGTEN